MSSHLHNLTRYYLSCFYLEKWKQREMFSNLSKVVSPVSGYSGTSSAWLLDPCVFFLLYPAGSSETLPYLLQLHSNLPLSDLFDASVSVCYIGFFFCYFLPLEMEFLRVGVPLKSNSSLLLQLLFLVDSSWVYVKNNVNYNLHSVLNKWFLKFILSSVSFLFYS